MKFTVDSNYLICVLHSWNPHHAETLNDLERRLDSGQEFHIVPHTLLEAYSVMTRMPEPFRKPPALVQQLLYQNFHQFPLTSIPGSADVWILLSDLAQQTLSGGQTYDRWIAWSAHRAGMQQLVTWNAKHFMSHPMPGLEITSPVIVG